jgi:hypothetical protein
MKASIRKQNGNLAKKEELEMHKQKLGEKLTELEEELAELRRQLRAESVEDEGWYQYVIELEDAKRESEDAKEEEVVGSGGSEWGEEKSEKNIDGYPPKLLYLFLQMLGNGVSTTSAPKVFVAAAAFFDPSSQIAEDPHMMNTGNGRCPLMRLCPGGARV